MAVKEVTTNIAPSQQIATLSTVQRLTVPAGARMALIQAEGQNIRWWDDGTVPTATVGMRLLAGDELYYDGELTKLQMIEEAVGAKANVSYYA